jgi:hypothetical protein
VLGGIWYDFDKAVAELTAIDKFLLKNWNWVFPGSFAITWALFLCSLLAMLWLFTKDCDSNKKLS